MSQKNINKDLIKSVNTIERKIKKEIKEFSINKRVLGKIESEASLLGKAKLIALQIIFLNKKLSKANKKVSQTIKNQLLFYYIELFKLNQKLHDSLLIELKSDAKLLKDRIAKKLRHRYTYEDIFFKLKQLAAETVRQGQAHLRAYYAATTNKKAHFRLVNASLKRLAIIYRLLKSEEQIVHFRHILLRKIVPMFKDFLKLTNKNAKLIAHCASTLGKSRKIKFDGTYQKIASIIDNQIKELHNFALNFNNYIIHSEPFYANGKKHILITHKVKPVF